MNHYPNEQVFIAARTPAARLLLVRHGETPWNVRYLFQGQTDLPLNPSGEAQAQALGRHLAHISLDGLISSDLRRAAQTALIIAQMHPSHPEVILEPRLREIQFGLWEGHNEVEIEQMLPGEVLRWKNDPDFPPSRGESITQAMSRLESLLAELRQGARRNLALVGHGGIFQALICQAMCIKPGYWWPFHLYNASISELWLYTKGASLTRLNDLHHLE